MSARILVVDDILPNVKLLEAKLSSQYYDVITASNGEEALQKVEQESPDLVLLDIMMPGMDGFEVCRRIKDNPEVAHVPVVMVTALTDVQDRVRGLEAGADDFLSKPIDDTALMARVRSLVRLKMALDEWRTREHTANQLGVVEQKTGAMDEPCGKAHVLVIEDKAFERKKIAETLEIDEDTVLSCETGEEAQEFTAKHDFDLIAVSLNLENEDALRFCSHIKLAERTRNVPILMIGGKEDMPRIAQGLEMGAHDYILRPVDKNELLARVRTQIRRKRFQDRLRETYEISLSMALTDSLTGLYNRRYLDVHLDKLLQKNQEARKTMAVLLTDIDHFKAVNDTYGHHVGDEVLQTFAARLKDNLRSFDLVARMGGEEFVAILPDVTPEKAYIIAERLRRSIGEAKFKCSAPEGEIDVTTSIGGVLVDSDAGHTTDEVLANVDKYLYEAKEDGRNCTVFEEIGRLDPADYPGRKRQMID